jgi:internalin A
MTKRKQATSKKGKYLVQKDENPAHIKPLDIKNIEEAYGIQLIYEPDFNARDFVSNPAYALNEKGEVIGLSIYDSDIDNISAICNIPTLTYLNLTRGNLSSIEEISSLCELESLYLGGNKIGDITPLSNCKNIKQLAIWDNPIKSAVVLHELKELETLYAQQVNFSDVSFELLSTKTKELGLDGCGIIDISGVVNMHDVDYISVSDNFIEDLSCCNNLSKLTHLDVRNNLISYIPKEFATCFGWLGNSLLNEHSRMRGARLVLNSNPLFFPPASVIELGAETVESYYSNAESYGYASLSEGRIIVIGDGSAGKSSLIERLLHDKFEQGKNQTNGIKIDNWELFHSDGRKLAFHLWDFGGQEIQHAVHKFFFTEGCLYILVLDNRKEEEPEYWLQQIESLGGGAPVLVVFNKHDDNASEITDRKFLKDKYPNIVGFYNTSCKTGFGIHDFKQDLMSAVVKLRTVDEQFPNNWFAIKQAIAEHTSGEKHYINYEYFKSICLKNNVYNPKIQKLLLRYLTTIGAVTWFGDTYLNFLHILSPAWITQGVYKIITAKKTAALHGSISVNEFSELLRPSSENDYNYDEGHYGYLLSMMKKFDLCYTANDKDILIPSAFGKMPKAEYGDYRGEGVKTYILSFKDYMPLALIHRFIAKKIEFALDGNFWYSGIVIRDEQTGSLAMVHADKEAKRIYVRIKGGSPLGVWEHIRRELSTITSSYASISYTEYVSLDSQSIYLVSYDELIGHIRVGRSEYFHAGLGREFKVGQLMGLFESQETTIEKFKSGEHRIENSNYQEVEPAKTPSIVVQILNQNNATAKAKSVSSAKAVAKLNVKLIKEASSAVQADANYLLSEIGNSNEELTKALSKIIEFAQDSKKADDIDSIKEKGWGRKLKSLVEVFAKNGDFLKKIKDGGEAMNTISGKVHELASHLNMHDIAEAYHNLEKLIHQL